MCPSELWGSWNSNVKVTCVKVKKNLRLPFIRGILDVWFLCPTFTTQNLMGDVFNASCFCILSGSLLYQLDFSISAPVSSPGWEPAIQSPPPRQNLAEVHKLHSSSSENPVGCVSVQELSPMCTRVCVQQFLTCCLDFQVPILGWVDPRNPGQCKNIQT